MFCQPVGASSNNNMFRLSSDNNLRPCCRRRSASFDIAAVKKTKQTRRKHVWSACRFGSGRDTLAAAVMDTPVRDQRLLGKKETNPLNLGGDSTAGAACACRSEFLHIKDFSIATPGPLLPKYIPPIKAQTRPN